MSKRIICWFSCGAASAVATKLTLAERPDAVIVYQNSDSEHKDNMRFLKDCEEWFGKKIIIQRSEKFKDHWEVIKARKYIVGVGGAPCTGELKRKLAENFINHLDDIEVFGYTAEEQGRVDRFKENNPERLIYPMLIEKGLIKQDCLALIAKSGIEIPAMYKLGYRNNNCIGCVKGQQGYWNKIRVDFPEVFERMAKQERKLNAAINKKYVRGKRIRIFLDELDPKSGNYESEASLDCGILCGIVDNEINQ